MSKKSFTILGLLFLWLPAASTYLYLPGDIKVLYFVRLVCSILILTKYIRIWRKLNELYWVLIYGICLLVSSFLNLNKNIDMIDFIITVEYVFYLLSMFVFVKRFSESDWKAFFKIIKVFAYIYIIMNMIMTIPFMGPDIEELGNIFFIGSRADSVQYFTIFISLMLIGDWRNQKYIKWDTFILSFLSITMVILYHSGQGIATFGVIFILEILFINKKRIFIFFLSPLKMILTNFILNFLAVSQLYMNIPFIIWIITKVMRKNINLTGRTIIYQNLPTLFDKSPVFGFGYRNNIIFNALGGISKGYNSPHNSLFIVLFNAGIIGLIPFIAILWHALKRAIKVNTKESLLLYSTIIGLMISGIVSAALGGNAYWFICAVTFFYIGTTENSKNNLSK